jgi:hypothetical protein
MIIKDICGREPHADYGGWEGFLETCGLRSEVDGVKYHGATNCNYILWPDGHLICNYGPQGRAMMLDIRLRGAAAVLADAVEFRAKLVSLLAEAGVPI